MSVAVVRLFNYSHRKCNSSKCMIALFFYPATTATSWHFASKLLVCLYTLVFLHTKDLLSMPKVVEYLSITDDYGNTPLHIAAASNYVGAVTLLLTKGVNCNAKNNMGSTPLHLAAAMGCDA